MNLKISIDHFILGINDLEKGIEDFYNKTGVKPVFGGIHEGAGTHNALVALDNNVYLEILAPQKKDAQTVWGSIPYQELTPIGWILNTNDSGTVLKSMEQFQIPNSGSRNLSRKTSEGELLKWKNIFHSYYGNLSLNPFFIEWGEEVVHPSQTTPKGCTLDAFVLNLKNKNGLINFLDSLDLNLPFNTKEDGKSGDLLELRLETPKGKVCFCS